MTRASPWPAVQSAPACTEHYTFVSHNARLWLPDGGSRVRVMTAAPYARVGAAAGRGWARPVGRRAGPRETASLNDLVRAVFAAGHVTGLGSFRRAPR